ncbi:MAG: MerR family transcriptional regulator [Bacteroidota bacterium]|nr:MerR family transcriptional regulator [Bacteroidota bacterium]MDE2955604.1 MerR family transcriptional regulator [Bacteroidota bacterium]
MTMQELTHLTGITARQARYLIAEGFMPAPTGGRAHAKYGEAHLSAIWRYQRLRAAGFAPASIRLLLKTRTGVPVEVIPGVTLVVDPKLIASNTPVTGLSARISTALEQVLSVKISEDSNEK